ncbi:hypothetical protein Tco_0088702 [Tanacetum coccineum]
MPVHMNDCKVRGGLDRSYLLIRLAVRHSADHHLLFQIRTNRRFINFHSDASSDSSLRHSLSDHSSPDLPSTFVGLSPDVEVEVNECFAYTDALKDRGIDVRVVVEAVNREESETGARGPLRLRMRHWEIWFRGSMITQRLFQSIIYRSLREFIESRDIGLLGLSRQSLLLDMRGLADREGIQPRGS